VLPFRQRALPQSDFVPEPGLCLRLRERGEEWCRIETAGFGRKERIRSLD
jgi:hypothetical protein